MDNFKDSDYLDRLDHTHFTKKLEKFLSKKFSKSKRLQNLQRNIKVSYCVPAAQGATVKSLNFFFKYVLIGFTIGRAAVDRYNNNITKIFELQVKN